MKLLTVLRAAAGGAGVAAPAPPSGLAVTGMTAGVVADLTPEFTVDALPENATLLRWQWGNDASFVVSSEATSTDPDYTVTVDLLNFIPAYVRVRAEGDGGNSDWSETISFMPSVFLLRDDFSVDEAAPVTSPRASDVGTLTLIQNDGSYAIASGAKTNTAQTTAAWGDLAQYDTVARSRSRGLAFGVRVTFSSITDVFGVLGWLSQTSAAPTLTGRFGVSSGGLYDGNGALSWHSSGGQFVGISPLSLSTGTEYDFVFVLRDPGAWIFGKGGVLGAEMELQWVFDLGAGSPIYAGWNDNSWAKSEATMRVAHLGGAFTAQEGIATINANPAVSGSEYASADGDYFADIEITAPGTLDADSNTRCGVYYRTDATMQNGWHVYFDGTGAFRLDSIASGVRTNHINATTAITGGATRTITIRAKGSTHNCWTLAGAIGTNASAAKRGDNISLTLNDTETRLIPVAPAGWTLGRLRVYPKRAASYDVLETFLEGGVAYSGDEGWFISP